MLVFNATLFDVDRVTPRWRRAATARLRHAAAPGHGLLAGTFFFSSVANYVLARWVVTSPAGTEAFNQELGRLTLLSYPVIAIALDGDDDGRCCGGWRARPRSPAWTWATCCTADDVAALLGADHRVLEEAAGVAGDGRVGQLGAADGADPVEHGARVGLGMPVSAILRSMSR
jgi:hypothetical protein